MLVVEVTHAFVAVVMLLRINEVDLGSRDIKDTQLILNLNLDEQLPGSVHNLSESKDYNKYEGMNG